MSDAAPTAGLRDELGRLTAGPLPDFVAARTARAKQLKAAGQAELARELAGCRKPTVPAWAADQLAHHHPDELDGLFAAADRVRSTQSVADPDRDAVRAASTGFTAQVRRLRSLAGDHMVAAGTAPEAHLDEVEATLLAAATDDAVAADLRAGALLRPAPSPGFAALASLAAPGRSGRSRGSGEDRGVGRPGAADDPPDDAGDVAAARRAEELEAIRSRRAELAERHADAEAAVHRAEEAAASARARLVDLRAEVARLQRDAVAAEEELAAGEEAERAARRAADDLADEVAALDEQAARVAPATT